MTMTMMIIIVVAVEIVEDGFVRDATDSDCRCVVDSRPNLSLGSPHAMFAVMASCGDADDNDDDEDDTDSGLQRKSSD